MKVSPRSTDAQGQPSNRTNVRRVTLLGLTAVMFAVVAVLCGLKAVGQWEENADSSQATRDAAILTAANDGVTAMISVRDTSAAEDVQKVLDLSTGTFQKDFEARSQSFISVVQEAKVVTEGHVIAQGIESRDGDSAVVLVSATSTVSNAAGAANETRSWRLRVTMTEAGGQYKMSNVEFVA